MLDGSKEKGWHSEVKLDYFINPERSDKSLGQDGKRDLYQRCFKENQHEPWKHYAK